MSMTTDESTRCGSAPGCRAPLSWNAPHWPFWRSGCGIRHSETPTLPIRRMNVSIGGVVVGEERLLIVPLERLTGEANGNGTEQRRLRQRPAVTEVGPRLTASADRFNPVPGMVFDPGKLFGWGILAGVLLHDILRQQPTAAGSVRTVHDHPLVAKEDRPGARHLVVSREVLGLRNLIVAVVPDKFDGAALVAGGKLEGDLRAGRKGQALFRRIIIGYLRLHRRWRVQVQRPERRIDDVAKPVADGARAERRPAAPSAENPEGCVRTKGNRTDPPVIVEPFGHLIMLVELVEIADLAIQIPHAVT